MDRPERLRLRDSARYVGRVYAEQAGPLLAVAVLLFVPLGLLDALGEHGWELDTDDLSVGKVIGLMLGIVAQVTTATLGEVFYAGVAMAAVMQSMEGRPRAPLDRVMRNLPYGRLIVVDILFSLGLAVGLALLLIPGLVFFARYILAAPLLEIERYGVADSFRRSRRVARGHALPLLALLGGLWVLTDGLTSLLQDGATGSLGEGLWADWAIAVVTSVAFTPLWAVAACVATWQLLQAERSARA
ncbi:MAG TPA: hypothetical protein VFB44_10175 [Thermoleophilaceae bacterium]|nr:hypothetical protein [Thermoleophilaceae bacterium]